ncbi:MAG: P-loop NTPase [Longimicrobiales bacterium]
MSDTRDLLSRITTALGEVINPVTGNDIVSGGHVQELSVTPEAEVRFQFVLSGQDSGALVRAARAAAEGVAGVRRVKVDVKLPQTAPRSTGPARTAPSPRHKPGTVPTPSPPEPLRRGMRHVIAVSSGKGGVGKSTVAANLAAALGAQGHAVGLLDADIYGPDIPLLFGETGKPRVTGQRGSEKIVPLEAHGVKLMSLGFLLDPEQPAIMRGPLVSGILRQFLEQVEWGELDYLIVDMPPGTGDAQLSLVQTIELDGAVMVTTPQEMSTGDVRRGIRMFERTNTRVLGIVENMSGLDCPHCGGHINVFGQHGGRLLAEDMGLPLLGTIPLDPSVREAGDAGQPTALHAADSPAGRAMREIALRVAEVVDRVPAGA